MTVLYGVEIIISKSKYSSPLGSVQQSLSTDLFFGHATKLKLIIQSICARLWNLNCLIREAVVFSASGTICRKTILIRIVAVDLPRKTSNLLVLWTILSTSNHDLKLGYILYLYFTFFHSILCSNLSHLDNSKTDN